MEEESCPLTIQWGHACYARVSHTQGLLESHILITFKQKRICIVFVSSNSDDAI